MGRAKSRIDLSACLIGAWEGIFELEIDRGKVPTGVPALNWIAENEDIHIWSAGNDMRCIGFSRQGALALRQLIRGLRKSNDRHMRLVGLFALTDHVAEHLRETWKVDNAQRPDLVSLTNEIDGWLSSHAGVQRHFIPCRISADPAPSFNIGPVLFVHIDRFKPTDFGKTGANITMVTTRWKKEHHTDWIAVIDISHRERLRSLELAELIVDLGLGVIQTIARDIYGRDITRVTGRSLLGEKVWLAVNPGGAWDGGWGLRASFDMPGAVLEEFLRQSAPEIQHMGRIIGRYRDQSSRIPLLEQGWCDALFWFHEGLSEPLDSVAIAKMETAIENLFCAESSAGSRRRLSQGFKCLFGGSSPVDALLPVTVDEFIDAIVTARSRILHGTWSTLANTDVEVDRRDVARLTQNFLMIAARALDVYAGSSNPTDDIVGFLAWAEGSRRDR
jgi:hypothetical protein